MRPSIFFITTATILGLAIPALAQDSDQGNSVGTPLSDLFAFGETVVIDYDPIDIEAQIQQLVEEACAQVDSDDETVEPSVDTCIFGPGSDFPSEVLRNQEERLTALLAAQTRITAARAETEAARFEGILARAIALRNQAQTEAGIVIDADAFANAMQVLEVLENELATLANTVFGDWDIAEDGLDAEVLSHGERIYELEEMVSNFAEYEITVANWCTLNPNVSLCEAFGYYGSSNN